MDIAIKHDVIKEIPPICQSRNFTARGEPFAESVILTIYRSLENDLKHFQGDDD
jgi:hypothetical protein